MKKYLLTMLKAVIPFAEQWAKGTANKVDDGAVELLKWLVDAIDGRGSAEQLRAALEMIDNKPLAAAIGPGAGAKKA